MSYKTVLQLCCNVLQNFELSLNFEINKKNTKVCANQNTCVNPFVTGNTLLSGFNLLKTSKCKQYRGNVKFSYNSEASRITRKKLKKCYIATSNSQLTTNEGLYVCFNSLCSINASSHFFKQTHYHNIIIWRIDQI